MLISLGTAIQVGGQLEDELEAKEIQVGRHPSPGTGRSRAERRPAPQPGPLQVSPPARGILGPESGKLEVHIDGHNPSHRDSARRRRRASHAVSHGHSHGHRHGDGTSDSDYVTSIEYPSRAW